MEDPKPLGKRDPQAPQFPEDQHGPKYDNDVPISGWPRDADATTKPSFDKGNAWRKQK